MLIKQEAKGKGRRERGEREEGGERLTKRDQDGNDQDQRMSSRRMVMMPIQSARHFTRIANNCDDDGTMGRSHSIDFIVNAPQAF